MTRAEEVQLCREYAQRLAKSLLATKQKLKISGKGDVRILYAWLGVPLDFVKRHDERYIACVLFFLMEENKTVFKEAAVQNLLSGMKSIHIFDNRSLELLLRIREINQVTRSISELRNLLQKIVEGLAKPDMELIGDALDWLDKQRN